MVFVGSPLLHKKHVQLFLKLHFPIRLLRTMWKLCLTIISFIAFIEAQKRNYSGGQCPSSCYCFRRTVRCMKLDLSEIPKAPLHTITL